MSDDQKPEEKFATDAFLISKAAKKAVSDNQFADHFVEVIRSVCAHQPFVLAAVTEFAFELVDTRLKQVGVDVRALIGAEHYEALHDLWENLELVDERPEKPRHQD